ncbi:MAG TPA: hypothetical protein PLW24_09230 [Burkholderiaceae bacterium]|nr:hypothetical protein [Burkholderiaceae bacterium]HNG79638.1 hypothetical protein [Burkholderiaceae bacterium]
MNPDESLLLELRQEMTDDQISAHRMAIAWIMAKLAPEEAGAWLTLQREAIQGSAKLTEVALELAEIQEDLDQLLSLRS